MSAVGDFDGGSLAGRGRPGEVAEEGQDLVVGGEAPAVERLWGNL